VLVFGYRHRDELARLLASVKLPGGIELTFREQLDDAIAERGTAPVPDADRSRVLRRAGRDAAITHGARILWVDDAPGNNILERKLLRSLGIMIDLARSSEEGLEMLGRADFDLVISDIARAGGSGAGITFLKQMRATKHFEPVALYIMNLDRSRGTPGDAIGITNRPDELVHLVLDGVERARG
jgi:CheY-like chemotaxis protein